ncbi:MAG: 6,7-dimethyl-8-ribityllumazine synthase [Candidatus Sericytochromatia bacterium]|uniref:6,7-dimethyl-8-ribityllumazine synthase n=1 Tax=Candidatus Tanganyikabacteria bacterium TaxID=2961651 RepID=A0A937X5F4_9BACT|nr:6,7-dimethyl-8-ribityllumazine synthase [Candidatus Tanganyikabacteria bacterium]
MPKTLSASLDAKGRRFALVAARFNSFIVERLVSGAVDALKRHGVGDDDITVVWVPGSFEIPVVARMLARAESPFDAVVCLGCVIRGDTPHFDYVAGECARGVAEIARNAEMPVIFGVLTTETLEQAIDRAGAKAGNKGWESAMAAIEMANLLPTLP